jgi:hypothetical protein
MTGFLGNSTHSTQFLQPDDESGNSANFMWDRPIGGPLTFDFLWPRSRLGSGTGIGLFTNSLDASRPIWDWSSWVMPGGCAGMGQKNHSVSGVTYDQFGVIVGGATVDMFRTYDDVRVGTTISDPITGAFNVAGTADNQTVYLVAYKATAPDITGATVNTIITTY